MFLRGIGRGSHELRVVAVLLYAFGLSLRKTSRFFWMGALESERVSKSSVEEWVRRVEGKLNFDAEPSWHQAIAVDESVAKCSGRPIYVWVAVDAYTRQPICLVRGITHKDHEERPQVSSKAEEVSPWETR